MTRAGYKKPEHLKHIYCKSNARREGQNKQIMNR